MAVVTRQTTLTSGKTGKRGRVVNIVDTGAPYVPNRELYVNTISAPPDRARTFVRGTEAIIALTILIILIIIAIAIALFWYYFIRVPTTTFNGGTVPGTCAAQGDCPANFSCDNGICRGGIGANCGFGGCVSGLVCVDNTCLKQTGQDCTDSDQCKSGICDGICKADPGGECFTVDTSQCTSGTCFNGRCRLGAGVACNSDIECVSNNCFEGFCRGDINQICSADNQCLVPLNCDPPCQPQACVLTIPTCINLDPNSVCDNVGEASNYCIRQIGQSCIRDSQCNAGFSGGGRVCGVLETCANKAGLPCSQSSHCASNICSLGTCACSLDKHCSPGQVCQGGVCV